MKPLTIEQLKALEVGDWVWVIDLQGESPCYRKKDNDGDTEFCAFLLSEILSYSDYGTKWLAYKNKEQMEGVYDKLEAECDDKEQYTIELYNRAREAEHELKEIKTRMEKGEIVELLCKVGDEIFVPWIWDDTDGIMNLTVTSITFRNKGTDYYCNNLDTDDINFAKQFDLGNFHSTDYNSIWFTDQSEAKHRLAELKGEKE